jgi:exonuclease III
MLKIITWNCNMAFRKKADFILVHKPDILIVPECEHPSKLKFNVNTPLPSAIVWHGSNPHKGLGVFSYGPYRLQLMDQHTEHLKTILPIHVSGNQVDITLLAIWAYNAQDKDYNYIGQVWKGLHQYEDLLKNENILLAGDFNSNVFWDSLHRKSNHSMVVEKLANLNIGSTYHAYYQLAQGAEKHPTFFLYRHENKPYHIDYCFASKNLMEKLKIVKVGKHNEWAHLSDHTPLFVSIAM